MVTSNKKNLIFFVTFSEVVRHTECKKNFEVTSWDIRFPEFRFYDLSIEEETLDQRF